MSDTAIRVEKLGKRYRLGQRERYKTFRDALARAALAPFRRLRSASQHAQVNNTFWALKDVSFEVQQGEVLGIIAVIGEGVMTAGD